jgi:hypothetical protein
MTRYAYVVRLDGRRIAAFPTYTEAFQHVTNYADSTGSRRPRKEEPWTRWVMEGTYEVIEISRVS